jgi:hypothetical protein
MIRAAVVIPACQKVFIAAADINYPQPRRLAGIGTREHQPR